MRVNYLVHLLLECTSIHRTSPQILVRCLQSRLTQSEGIILQAGKNKSNFTIDEVMHELCHPRTLNSRKLKLERTELDQYDVLSQRSMRRITPQQQKPLSVKRLDFLGSDFNKLTGKSDEPQRLSYVPDTNKNNEENKEQINVGQNVVADKSESKLVSSLKFIPLLKFTL